MKQIVIFDRAGGFAENKDIAQEIRIHGIIPALKKNQEVILDFDQVEASTQSFIHALISDVIRNFGVDVLDRILFKSCNKTVKELVNIVVDYMQD